MVCTKCGIEKTEEEFDLEGHRRRKNCKECRRKTKREHYHRNRVKLIAQNRLYKLKNAEKLKPGIKERSKKYYAKNKEKIKEKHRFYLRRRIAEDPLYVIRKLISRRVNLEMNGAKNGKTLSSLKINVIEILNQIGKRPDKSYHLDHVLPISAFDYMNPIHIAASYHHSNLQWLTAKENVEKSDKYDELEFKRYLAWFQNSVWPSLQQNEQTG